jgi:hypothetical protein
MLLGDMTPQLALLLGVLNSDRSGNKSGGTAR